MPLIKKEEFVPTPCPSGLKPTTEVFYCPSTKEVFTDFDEFFNRTILLNSLVWSCSVTGKSGLTYEEAMDSEKEALESLDAFPQVLNRPIAFIIGLTKRGRLDDLTSDVWAFMKGRFFRGEKVEVVCKGSGGEGDSKKILATVSRIRFHEEGQVQNKGEGFNPDADQTGNVVMSGARVKEECRAWNATHFTYDLLINSGGDSESSFSLNETAGSDQSSASSSGGQRMLKNVLPSNIFRLRTEVSKGRLRLFVKNFCNMQTDQWNVKPMVYKKWEMGAVTWERVFAGPVPVFPNAPSSKRVVHQNNTPNKPKAPELPPLPTTSVDGKKLSKAAMKKLEAERKLEQKNLKDQKFLKAKEMQDRECGALLSQARLLGLNESLLTRWTNLSPAKLLKTEDMADLRTEIKNARLKDKERLQEEKRKEKEALIEWRRPRDDLLCDDLKPLPAYSALKLPDWLTAEMFASVLSVMEFVRAYMTECGFQDYLPVGQLAPSLITIFSSKAEFTATDDKEDPRIGFFLEALVAVKRTTTSDDDNDDDDDDDGGDNDSGGDYSNPFIDLLHALLNGLGRLQEEEDGSDEATNVNGGGGDGQKDETTTTTNHHGSSAVETELDNKRYFQAIRQANTTSENIRQTHGLSLRNIPRNRLNMTEIVRLVLLCGGYYQGAATTKFRYHNRGQYRCWDDQLLQFRLKNPALLARLRKYSILTLTPLERLSILEALISQLMTFYRIRDTVEGNLERVKQLKIDLKTVDRVEEKQVKDYKSILLERSYETRLMETYKDDMETYEKVKEEATAKGEPAPSPPSPINIPPRTEPSNDTRKLKRWISHLPSKEDLAEQHLKGLKQEMRDLLTHVDFGELDDEELPVVRMVQEQFNKLDKKARLNDLIQAHFAAGLLLLGRDRAYRKYWFSDGLDEGGILVEEEESEWMGECEDVTPLDRFIAANNNNNNNNNSNDSNSGGDSVPEESSKDPTAIRRLLFACSGSPENCVVHGAEQAGRPHWHFISKRGDLDTLRSSLNPRGFREQELLENVNLIFPKLLQLLPPSDHDDKLKDCSSEEASISQNPSCSSTETSPVTDTLLDSPPQNINPIPSYLFSDKFTPKPSSLAGQPIEFFSAGGSTPLDSSGAVKEPQQQHKFGQLENNQLECSEPLSNTNSETSKNTDDTSAAAAAERAGVVKSEAVIDGEEEDDDDDEEERNGGLLEVELNDLPKNEAPPNIHRHQKDNNRPILKSESDSHHQGSRDRSVTKETNGSFLAKEEHQKHGALNNWEMSVERWMIRQMIQVILKFERDVQLGDICRHYRRRQQKDLNEEEQKKKKVNNIDWPKWRLNLLNLDTQNQMISKSVSILSEALISVVKGIQLEAFDGSLFAENNSQDKDGSKVSSGGTVLDKWLTECASVSSVGQLDLFATTIQKAINPRRSKLHIRCRDCRRKGDIITDGMDGEELVNLLLCSDCRKPYHFECARPDPPALCDRNQVEWSCYECVAAESRRNKKAATSNKNKVALAANNGSQHNNHQKRKDVVTNGVGHGETDSSSSSSNKKQKKGPVDAGGESASSPASSTNNKKSANNNNNNGKSSASNLCEICNKEVRDKGSIECKVCGDRYHSGCNKVSYNTRVSNDWKCPKCLVPASNASGVVTNSGRVVRKRRVYDGDGEESIGGSTQRQKTTMSPTTAMNGTTGRSSRQHHQVNGSAGSESKRPKRSSTTGISSYKETGNSSSSDEVEDEDEDEPMLEETSGQTTPNTHNDNYAGSASTSSGDRDGGSLMTNVDQLRLMGMGLRGGSRSMTSAEQKQVQKIIETARKHEEAWPFLMPVSKEIVGYYDLIKNPIDLRTMLNKLKNNRYESKQQVVSDAKLMFTNCRTFNTEDAPVYQAGQKLEKFMMKLFREAGIRDLPSSD